MPTLADLLEEIKKKLAGHCEGNFQNIIQKIEVILGNWYKSGYFDWETVDYGPKCRHSRSLYSALDDNCAARMVQGRKSWECRSKSYCEKYEPEPTRCDRCKSVLEKGVYEPICEKCYLEIQLEDQAKPEDD